MVDPYDNPQAVQAQEVTMADEDFSHERMAQMTTLDVITHHPSQFNISANSNEITIVGGNTRTLLEGGQIVPVVKLEYNFELRMSPQSAKDLLRNLSLMVSQYEKEYGPITTDMQRRFGTSDEQE